MYCMAILTRRKTLKIEVSRMCIVKLRVIFFCFGYFTSTIDETKHKYFCFVSVTF